jgi:hypothetical protein
VQKSFTSSFKIKEVEKYSSDKANSFPIKTLQNKSFRMNTLNIKYPRGVPPKEMPPSPSTVKMGVREHQQPPPALGRDQNDLPAA